MKRQWFRDDDGTFYRNCPLIKDEMDRALRRGRLLLHRKLEAEWWQAWYQGGHQQACARQG